MYLSLEAMNCSARYFEFCVVVGSNRVVALLLHLTNACFDRSFVDADNLVVFMLDSEGL